MTTSKPADQPDLGLLTRLLNLCSPNANGWSRIRDNEAVRYCRWSGQSPDGKKHQAALRDGEVVFPFEGATDSRIPVADEIIREATDFLVEAYSRAMMNVQGNAETANDGRATAVRNLLQWIRGGRLNQTLLREVNLLASHGATYGASVWQIGWDRTFGYRMHSVTLEDVKTMAAQAAPDSPLANFPLMLADPNLEAEAVEVMKLLHRYFVNVKRDSTIEEEPKELSTKRAREAVRELREEGECDLPLPYLCKNEPRVRARKLWEDAFVPDVTDGVQDAPAWFFIDWYSESELQALAKANEWNEEWLEQALKQKGMASEWSTANRTGDPTATSDILLWNRDDRSEMIEVITAYRKDVDEDGVLTVWETIYHGNITRAPGSSEDLVARHCPLEYSVGTRYPVVGWTFEDVQRPFTWSRGVPQIVATWQRNLKALEDACVDRTALETCPPIIVEQVMGVDYKFGPYAQVPIRRGAMKPEAMNIGGTPSTAEFLFERIEKRLNRYFGRPQADEPPETSLIKRQKLVRSFLFACSEMLSMVLYLSLNHLPKEQIQRITGAAELNPDEYLEDMYQLHFNVQEMSPEFVEQRLAAVEKIAATDSSGATDQAAVTRWRYRQVDPSLEQQLTTTVTGASQAVLDQVKKDFADMYVGIPPTLRENEPTAQMQMEFANQILSTSDDYRQALVQKPKFKNLVELWMKSKQLSIDQAENRQTGRVGVSNKELAEA